MGGRIVGLALLALCGGSSCRPELLQGDTAAEAIEETVRTDPLPSWNDRQAKRTIVDFVEHVTADGGPEYVPPERRIAVFDNDGTLWGEQPVYVELAFALDRVKALAPVHPQWRERPALAAAIDGDLDALAATGPQGAVELLAATHAGMTTEDFERTVRDWIETAKHPMLGVRYSDLAYKPMLEVLRYLDGHGFKTFIVSGGGVEFMRPWAEKVYGIPRERIIGSRGKLEYEPRDGKPALVKEPEIELVDDGPGKPVGIQALIGRRPIVAFGNSDGDFQMLEWTTSQEGPHLGVLIHHTDGNREWAYDRDSKIGKLSRGLDEAGSRGWVVVDMKQDWRAIYGGKR
ncbi:MAG: haloacid dehalogenase-like hydrolase [Polyangiaceae bacterium]|nr:haloacid dehalogenase-like hydrolase [Polyangiaceae bacterium]